MKFWCRHKNSKSWKLITISPFNNYYFYITNDKKLLTRHKNSKSWKIVFTPTWKNHYYHITSDKKLWFKHKKSKKWKLIPTFTWENYYYIEDNNIANIQKLKIAYPDAKIEVYDNKKQKWKKFNIKKIQPFVKYKVRIKPIFKIGDKIIRKNYLQNIYSNSIITKIVNNKYYLNHSNKYIKIKDQFKFKKMNKKEIK